MIIAAIIVGLLTAFYASSKGYNGFIWFFAGGLLGILVLLFLAKANDPYLSPHEQAKLKSNGDIVGGVIAGLSIILGLVAYFAVPY